VFDRASGLSTAVYTTSDLSSTYVFLWIRVVLYTDCTASNTFAVFWHCVFWLQFFFTRVVLYPLLFRFLGITSICCPFSVHSCRTGSCETFALSSRVQCALSSTHQSEKALCLLVGKTPTWFQSPKLIHLKWSKQICGQFVCPVTSSGQTTSMLLFPMRRHVSTSWSSWSELEFQWGTCCTSTLL